MAFSNNLTYLRKKHNMSQEQLAEVLGVTRQAVSKWEAGQSTPDVEKLLQLSELFLVPVDQMLKDIEEENRQENGHDVLYTVLAFIALAIVWFTGLILVIVNVFFNTQVLQVSILYCSYFMIAGSGIVFVAMLARHHIKKERRKQNEKQPRNISSGAALRL